MQNNILPKQTLQGTQENRVPENVFNLSFDNAVVEFKRFLESNFFKELITSNSNSQNNVELIMNSPSIVEWVSVLISLNFKEGNFNNFSTNLTKISSLITQIIIQDYNIGGTDEENESSYSRVAYYSRATVSELAIGWFVHRERIANGEIISMKASTAKEINQMLKSI